MINNNLIVIIDYGMGNLRSVQKKLIRVNANVEISNNPLEISKADKIVLPGVGHFANGIKNLKELKIWDVLFEKVQIKKTPILGICLGMQLMARKSEEGKEEGLGWFDAEVIKFSIEDKLKFKVPHMGWNNVSVQKDSELFKNTSDDSLFYFVHSYHFNCYNKKDILATTQYELTFTSAVQKENIFGTQFHPEKSHDWGENLLKNFVNL